jgi:hypothetical protein
MLRKALVSIVLLSVAGVGRAAELKPATAAAFDHYIQITEREMGSDSATKFLHVDRLPADQRDAEYARLRGGEVISERLQTLENGNAIPIAGGMIHHWLSVAFVKGTTLHQTLVFLQDYDHQGKHYSPDVQRSKLLQRNGDEFKIFLRLRKHKVVTVLLNSEYDVKYTTIDQTHANSRSISTRIAEVENADKPDGPEKPVGNDDGYLWRLNSYWRFYEHDGGVYIQLEAVSLTRDIPTGLGWVVSPFVTSIPKESLAFTLTRTRDALQKP